LDLGCGSGAVWQGLIPKTAHTRIGVDFHAESLNLASFNKVYTEVHVANLLTYLGHLDDNSVDSVLSLCVIEHLPFEDGKLLALEMRRVAAIRAVIFTPNGFVPQLGDFDNPYQAHLSGWTRDSLFSLGYKFYAGFNGLKYLRTTYGLPTFKPKLFGELIALLSGWAFNHNSQLAFQLLVVADKQLTATKQN
jgi:SAM-dependent methyltransferase